MNKIMIFIWVILLSQISFAQNRAWYTPDCNNNIYTTGLKIQRVEFYSNATVLSFKYNNSYSSYGWVQLSTGCQLVAYPSGKKLKMISSNGIHYAPSKHYFSSKDEILEFTCVFQAVPEGTTSIDWIEEGDWVIKNIRSVSNTKVSHSQGRRYGGAGAGSQNSKGSWDKPQYTTTDKNKGLVLEKVCFYSQETILWFKYTNHHGYGGWCSLNRNAKIIAYPSNKTLYLQKKTDGIPFSPQKHTFKNMGEVLLFNLFFPALPEGTTRIDFIESPDSEWKMYNITDSSPTSNNSSTSLNNSRNVTTKTVGRSVSTSSHTWTLKQIDFTSSKTVCRWSVTPKNTYTHMIKGVYLLDNKGKILYAVV